MGRMVEIKTLLTDLGVLHIGDEVDCIFEGAREWRMVHWLGLVYGCSLIGVRAERIGGAVSPRSIYGIRKAATVTTNAP